MDVLNEAKASALIVAGAILHLGLYIVTGWIVLSGSLPQGEMPVAPSMRHEVSGYVFSALNFPISLISASFYSVGEGWSIVLEWGFVLLNSFLWSLTIYYLAVNANKWFALSQQQQSDL